MIVSIQCPSGKSAVAYGISQIQIADDQTLDVPDYVAKSIVALPGFSSSADLTATAASMLAADQPFEANYLFWAHGKVIPAEDQAITDAGLLLAQRGVPACSAS